MKLSETLFAAVAVVGIATAQASTFTESVFAAGTSIGATAPDPVVYGDGSLWIAYQNGAASDGSSGSSTVARYSLSGVVQNQWTIAGNVDGLRIDPTGLVWALQNNDGNSTLTTIDPNTNGTTSYTYGSSYTNVANRGFDDVQFSNGTTFLSETNPASPTDPILLKLTTSLTSPLQVTGVLNAGSITDPDSLVLAPNGDLALTGEADHTIVFIHNPGTASQSVTYLPLTNITGNPDDTVFPNAPQGTFYVTDPNANKVYAISASGLAPNSVLIDAGNVFGSLDTSTGVVTPIFTGENPHGVIFVASTPEPSSIAGMFLGILVFAAYGWRQRRIKG